MTGVVNLSVKHSGDVFYRAEDLSSRRRTAMEVSDKWKLVDGRTFERDKSGEQKTVEDKVRKRVHRLFSSGVYERTAIAITRVLFCYLTPSISLLRQLAINANLSNLGRERSNGRKPQLASQRSSSSNLIISCYARRELFVLSFVHV